MRIIKIFFLAALIVSFSVQIQAEVRTLVVYYSRDGHTKEVAEKIARELGAETEELIDTVNRNGILGTTRAGKDALAKNLTLIHPIQSDLSLYDRIIVGSPAWFSTMTPAVRTFLSENDLRAKECAFFATCHKVGADKVVSEMSRLVNDDESRSCAKLPLTHADLSDEKFPGLMKQFVADIDQAARVPHT
jgi:flavodoxin